MKSSDVAVWALILSLVTTAIGAATWLNGELRMRDAHHALEANVDLGLNGIRQEYQAERLKDEHFLLLNLSDSEHLDNSQKALKGYLTREVKRRERYTELLEKEALILEQQVRKDLRRE